MIIWILKISYVEAIILYNVVIYIRGYFHYYLVSLISLGHGLSCWYPHPLNL